MAGAAKYIWMHGELRPAEEGLVPFLSAGVQYGFSVFEGIRCYATERGPASTTVMSPPWAKAIFLAT